MQLSLFLPTGKRTTELVTGTTDSIPSAHSLTSTTLPPSTVSVPFHSTNPYECFTVKNQVQLRQPKHLQPASNVNTSASETTLISSIHSPLPNTFSCSTIPPAHTKSHLLQVYGTITKYSFLIDS